MGLSIFGKCLQAEIEQVQIRWNAFQCLDICIPSIQRSLQSIPQVSNIQTNASEGTATMKWDSNYPFNQEAFRVASSMAGIRFSEIILQVKGTVSHDAQHFYLTSYGDHTRFLIIGPPQIEPGRQTPRRFNIVTLPLDGQTKEQLLDAERNHWIVSISGPLFPRPSSNLILMAQHIKIFVPEGSR